MSCLSVVRKACFFNYVSRFEWPTRHARRDVPIETKLPASMPAWMPTSIPPQYASQQHLYPSSTPTSIPPQFPPQCLLNAHIYLTAMPTAMPKSITPQCPPPCPPQSHLNSSRPLRLSLGAKPNPDPLHQCRSSFLMESLQSHLWSVPSIACCETRYEEVN